jgi:effector-binding domain-containing protein
VTPRIEQRTAQPYAAIAATTSMRGGFGDVIDEALPAVREHLASLGIEPAGPPLVIYRVIDMSGDLHIEVGWPTASEIAPAGRVGSGSLPGGRYVVSTHVGPYDGLVDANEALQRWGDEQGLSFAVTDAPDGEHWDGRFESYPTDPVDEPDPARWETAIAYLLSD